MRRGVVAAYPSSLVDDDKVPQCLSCYGILTEGQAASIPAQDCELAARQGRVREFNGHLARYCAERGPNPNPNPSPNPSPNPNQVRSAASSTTTSSTSWSTLTASSCASSTSTSRSSTYT